LFLSLFCKTRGISLVRLEVLPLASVIVFETKTMTEANGNTSSLTKQRQKTMTEANGNTSSLTKQKQKQ
jgi:hypothetical protein